MINLYSALLFWSLVDPVAAYPSASQYVVNPFQVDLAAGVPRMLDLVRNTRLPDKPEYDGLGNSFGMDLSVLKSLRDEWLHSYDWNKDQAYMNSFKHYKTKIEGLDIHFIHEKSQNVNAIPLVLLHGWPGSFLEYLPLVQNLTEGVTVQDGRKASFDIIIPSLPGYGFSSAPPANWTVEETARVFNTLMVDVLGYPSYSISGSDWGCAVGYALYNQYSRHVKASHFVFIPFFPWDGDQLAAHNITLSLVEQSELARFVDWRDKGQSYFQELTTQPNTIGLAVYDSPMAHLAWIGQKFILWSDPRRGTPPSLLDNNEILRSVSLYYLTRTFISSGFTYAQNPEGFKANYTKARTEAPLLFSAFKYNVGFWPPALVAQVGNLVSYRNHDFGGHFPGLDNPRAMVQDLAEIKKYWK